VAYSGGALSDSGVNQPKQRLGPGIGSDKPRKNNNRQRANDGTLCDKGRQREGETERELQCEPRKKV